jgi:hypothetical protein
MSKFFIRYPVMASRGASCAEVPIRQEELLIRKFYIWNSFYGNKKNNTTVWAVNQIVSHAQRPQNVYVKSARQKNGSKSCVESLRVHKEI